jgi:hypothetical protein
MPQNGEYFETSAKELAGVLDSNWKTLTMIRSAITKKYVTPETTLLDGPIARALGELLATEVVEKSQDIKKRTRWRIKPGGPRRKMTEPSSGLQPA